MEYLLLCLGLLTLNVASVFSLRTYNMKDYCGKELSMILSSFYQGQLQFDVRESFSSGYSSSSLSCEMEIESWYSYNRILFYFEDLNLPCDTGYISIYDGSSSSSSRVNGLPEMICGTNKPTGTFTSSGLSIAIKYTPVTAAYKNDAFSLIFSSFHDASCRSYEYRCNNDRCIPSDNNCNGYNPCGDGSDCELTAGAIAGIVIGCLVAVGIAIGVIVAFVCCRRKRPGRSGVVMQPYSTQQTVSTFSNSPANQTAATWAPPAYSAAMGTAPPGQQWAPPAYPVQSYPGQQAPGVTVSTVGGSAQYSTGATTK